MYKESWLLETWIIDTSKIKKKETLYYLLWTEYKIGCIALWDKVTFCKNIAILSFFLCLLSWKMGT